MERRKISLGDVTLDTLGRVINELLRAAQGGEVEAKGRVAGRGFTLRVSVESE